MDYELFVCEIADLSMYCTITGMFRKKQVRLLINSLQPLYDL